MEASVDLTLVWAVIITLSIVAYVIMDGFDLGIGILFLGFPVGEDRDRAMNSIAPVWDGNETWLVLGGGGLLAAFPLAYATILPATYPLIIAMLLGLVFRGVAFEFRWRDPGHRRYWDVSFVAGSFVAAICQGMILGALIQGIDVEDRQYAGAWFDWLTPYTFLTGLGTLIGYCLLGSTWLILKTSGSLQRRARRIAPIAAAGTLAALAAVSLATLFLDVQYFARWTSMPAFLFTSQVPLSLAVLSWLLFRALAGGRELAPFLLSLGIFLLGFVGVWVSIYPYVVPHSVTIWEAAAPKRSQIFMLIGFGVTLPLIVGYTAWSYWIFRGKVENGYH